MKLNTSNFSKIAFISDTHYNHDREFLYGKRGFDDIEHHDSTVAQTLKNDLDEKSILFHIGDFSLNSSVEATKFYLEQIPCPVYLIWGNHESYTTKIYNQALKEKFGDVWDLKNKVYPLTWKNVTFLGDKKIISINKKKIVLSHFPFAIWDYMQHGGWHITGHSHGSFEDTTPESKKGKCLDVGIENNIRYTAKPYLTFDQIKEIMDCKEFEAKDHHDRPL